LCRPANLERRGIAGFTLIEALAALAVLGAGLAAIGPLASSSMRAGLYAERHLADIETARKIIAGMPSRESLPVGRLMGALDAHNWRIDSMLIGAPAAVGDNFWIPQHIEVWVQSPSGAVLKFDTIRLRKQAKK
jgi:general secretion pathway protein I